MSSSNQMRYGVETGHSQSGDTSTSVMIPFHKMAKMLKSENPEKFRYKFIVDCVGLKNWREVQKYMKKNGFVVRREDSIIGDHYGLKQFNTLSQARKAMSEMYGKFGKARKLNTITLEPVIMGR